MECSEFALHVDNEERKINRASMHSRTRVGVAIKIIEIPPYS